MDASFMALSSSSNGDSRRSKMGRGRSSRRGGGGGGARRSRARYGDHNNNNANRFPITVSLLNHIGRFALLVQMLVTASSLVAAFRMKSYGHAVGTSGQMFSFSLITWATSLPEGGSSIPFLISIFVLPPLNDVGLLQYSTQIEEMYEEEYDQDYQAFQVDDDDDDDDTFPRQRENQKDNGNFGGLRRALDDGYLPGHVDRAHAGDYDLNGDEEDYSNAYDNEEEEWNDPDPTDENPQDYSSTQQQQQQQQQDRENNNNNNDQEHHVNGITGLEMYATYGIFPLLGRSLLWFLAAMAARRAMQYDVEQALAAVGRFVVGMLPVFFISAGGLKANDAGAAFFVQDSKGGVLLMALFQSHVVQLTLFTLEILVHARHVHHWVDAWHAWDSVLDWMAVLHLYFLIAAALCFETLMDWLRSFYPPLESLLMLLWFVGPAVQLLTLLGTCRGWGKRRNAIVLEKAQDDDEGQSAMLSPSSSGNDNYKDDDRDDDDDDDEEEEVEQPQLLVVT